MKKLTIVPLHWVDAIADLPIQIREGLTIQRVDGLLKPENFSLWDAYISENKLKELPTFQVAILHQFDSEGHVGREEVASRELAQLAFVALRIIQPTRTRYSYYQCRVLEEGQLDLFSFQPPSEAHIRCPDSEALNNITTEHLASLRTFLPALIGVIDQTASPIRRSAVYYETAYATIQEPILQFITWMMGIESAFSELPLMHRRENLINEIESLIPRDFAIYSESPIRQHFDLPKLTVGDVLPDMFRLRSQLVHGKWLPKWKPEVTRPSLQGASIGYAQMLTEAAPLILRKMLFKLIQKDELSRR